MADKNKALTWAELRVGVVVILSLVLLAATILYVGSGGGSVFAPKYRLRALMADVNGLKPGAPVRVGGVEVGHVTSVEFAGETARGMVEVVMRLDRRVKGRVTTESEATLGALGLLGEKAVDISGASKGQVVEDEGYVRAAVEDPFKGLLSDASNSTEHLKRILARMDAGEGLVGKALRDDELYTRMVDVSVRLQGVMSKFESSQGPLGRLANDREMSSQMAAAVKGLESIVARIDAGHGLLGALSADDELRGDLKGLVRRFDEVSLLLLKGEGTAGRLLRDGSVYERLDSVGAKIDAVVSKLDQGSGAAGRLINDPELYNNLNGTLNDMRSLIGEVRKDPRKYLRVKVSLF